MTTQSPIIPRLTKVAPFLYRTTYKSYELPQNPIITSSGGCSSFKLGDHLVGRNFDWYYNNRATFIITCAKPGCYKSIGISSREEIDESLANSGLPSIYYNDLPWYTLDGVNEKGLYASTNVVPDDMDGGLTSSVPLSTQTAEIDFRAIVRYILDNYSSVNEAYTDLRDHVKINQNPSLALKHYGLHVMIADKNDCVVLEIVKGTLHKIQSTKSTNFWLYGVTFNSDGTVYSNKDVPTHLPTVDSGITSYGSGLERWNTICNYQNSNGDDPRELLTQIKYTNAYTKTSDIWYSEFVFDNDNYRVTVDSPVDDANLEFIIQASKTAYQNRTRDEEQTWQSTHSSVYDLDKLTLNVVVQEDTENEYNYSLKLFEENNFLLKVNNILCKFERKSGNFVRIGEHDYPYVRIGNQLWLAENLDYTWDGLVVGGGYSDTEQRANYKGNNKSKFDINSKRKCGLLYNWISVKYLNDNKSSLLPKGWRVPSKNEYDTMINLIGQAVAGKLLKAVNDSIDGNYPKNWNGTDAYGFNGLPSDFMFSSSRTDDSDPTVLRLWTVTQNGNYNAFYKNITRNQDYIVVNDNTEFGFQFSIRLVKDV